MPQNTIEKLKNTALDCECSWPQWCTVSADIQFNIMASWGSPFFSNISSIVLYPLFLSDWTLIIDPFEITQKPWNSKPIKSNPEKSFSSSLTMYIFSWLVDSKWHATLAYGSYPAALKLHRCVLFKQEYNKESHDLSIYWWPQLWVSWSKSTNYILHTFLYLESIQVRLHYYYKSHCMWIKPTKKTFWFQLESWRSLYSGVHGARDYNFLIFSAYCYCSFSF